ARALCLSSWALQGPCTVSPSRQYHSLGMAHPGLKKGGRPFRRFPLLEARFAGHLAVGGVGPGQDLAPALDEDRVAQAAGRGKDRAGLAPVRPEAFQGVQAAPTVSRPGADLQQAVPVNFLLAG